jgi:membrane associated rhomboid family serine protease
MSAVGKKLRLIYFPFLLIGISFIGLYTFINWVFFIKMDLFSVREEVRNFGLPLILPGIPILIWLTPRIELLKTKRKNENYRIFFQCIAWGTIGLSTIIAQEYVTTSSGKLTELAGINSITQTDKTRYYTVQNYFVSKQDFGLHSSVEVRGSRNDRLHFALFIALPIYETRINRDQAQPAAWIGINYHDEVSNRLSDNEKELKFKEFLENSQKDFNTLNVQEFTYLDRIGASDKLENYQEAMKKSLKFQGGNNIVLIPFKASFESRNGTAYPWIFGSFLIGSLIWLLMVGFAPFNEEALSGFFKGSPVSEEEGWKEYLSYFIPSRDFFATPLLLDLNIGIYLLMFLFGNGFTTIKPEALLCCGGNFAPFIQQGEYWRLATSTFLHAGIIHLFSNMCGLLFTGLCLEPLLGKGKLILGYLLTGIAASMTTFCWYDHALLSVGASGAVFGLNGILLAFLLTKKSVFSFLPELRSYLLVMSGVFAFINIFMGFVEPGIDNASHVGGLLSGLFLGFLLAKLDTREIYVIHAEEPLPIDP